MNNEIKGSEFGFVIHKCLSKATKLQWPRRKKIPPAVTLGMVPRLVISILKKQFTAWTFVHPRNSHISIGRCPREIWLFSGEQIFISPLCKGNKCILSMCGLRQVQYRFFEMNVLFHQANVLVNSAKWNLLAIFVYKIIISEHLWSYLY
jgi:hypothetical protein